MIDKNFLKNLSKFVNNFLKNHGILLFILILGGFFRFYNLNWDNGKSFHPDEKNIAIAVTKINFGENLNPEFNAYNGFPIYLVRIIGEVLFNITKNNEWVTDLGSISLISRHVSALASTITIVIIYLILQRLLGRKWGLVGAFLTAFNVGFLQYAHYGVTESLLVLFVVLITYISLKILSKSRLEHWFYLGIVTGLAVGTKTAALSFMIIPFTTWLILFLRTEERKPIRLGLFYVLISYLFFFATSPFTLLSYDSFRNSMNYEGGVVDGSIPVNYTLQFYDTNSYEFFIKNTFWHMGFGVFILGVIGVILVVLKIYKDKSNYEKYLPLLLFSVSYFVYVGGWYAQFIRYTLPIQPFFIIFCVFTVSQFYIKLKGKNKVEKNSLVIKMFSKLNSVKDKLRIKRDLTLGNLFVLWCIAILCLSSLVWSLMFMNVYVKESTRITASQWINENIPNQSVLLVEHWDNILPVRLDKFENKEYQHVYINNFDEDTLSKIEETSEKLSQGDYLVLASRRLSGTIPRANEIYPYTSYYYTKLFEGQLGYKEVKQFTSYPSLFGYEIKSENAEETFQVFDHPKIIIFKNEDRLDKELLYNRLKSV